MNKALKFIISAGFSALFLWLAFRKVAVGEVFEAAQEMTFLWILPFTIVILLAHYLRAERWKLLLSKEQEGNRLTLFTSVMLGYMLNYAFPRLGEVTRPVYVARKEKVSSSKLIGTIVLERVVDMLSMALLMVFVGVFLISDADKLSQILGTDITDTDASLSILIKLGIYGAVALILVFLGYRLMIVIAKKNDRIKSLFEKVQNLIKTFIEGVLAIKDLNSWPLFILYTVLIWGCYTLMTFIPFWMFNMQDIYQLGIVDALVITVIAAIGIVIPAPGGIGTYHWFTSQALWILYAVPEVTGLAYATINHATSMLVIVAITPLLLFLDKYYSMKKE